VKLELGNSVHSCNYSHLFLFGPRRAFHNLYLSLLYDSGSLKEQCEAFFCSKKKFYYIIYADCGQAFISGLAASKIYRQTGDAVWAGRAKKCIEKMQVWVDQGVPWNFKQKVCICICIAVLHDLYTGSNHNFLLSVIFSYY
jgi:hypothetical protein